MSLRNFANDSFILSINQLFYCVYKKEKAEVEGKKRTYTQIFNYLTPSCRGASRAISRHTILLVSSEHNFAPLIFVYHLSSQKSKVKCVNDLIPLIGDINLICVVCQSVLSTLPAATLRYLMICDAQK